MSKKIKILYQACLICCVSFFVYYMPAFAANPVYQDVNIRLLNNHLFEEKMIDFDDLEQFKEYTMIEDCEVFEQFFTNDFEWNQIRLAVKDEMENAQSSFQKTKIRVPGKIYLTRYNFSTQSFDLHEDSVFNDVGFFQLSNRSYDLCDGEYGEENIGFAIPNKYYLKPEVPFNLHRIPVSKILAQRLLNQIQPNKDKTRSVYIDINVTLDTFFEIDKKAKKGAAGHILGSVDSVFFYTDEFRRNKFKSIYYDAY